MDEKEKSKETFGGLASVIPQVFYDVIARIIPGGIILIILFVLSKGNIENSLESTKTYFSAEKSMSSFLFFCLWVLLSYGLAILMWRQIDWYNLLFDREKFRKKGISASKYDSYLYDYIKTKDSAAGARITKLSAEIHMTEVFSVGIFYTILYNSFLIICQIVTNSCPMAFNVWSEIILIIFLLSSHSLRNFFEIRVNRAIHNYFIIYGNPSLTQISYEIKTLEEGLEVLENEPLKK